MHSRVRKHSLWNAMPYPSTFVEYSVSQQSMAIRVVNLCGEGHNRRVHTPNTYERVDVVCYAFTCSETLVVECNALSPVLRQIQRFAAKYGNKGRKSVWGG